MDQLCNVLMKRSRVTPKFLYLYYSRRNFGVFSVSENDGQRQRFFRNFKKSCSRTTLICRTINDDAATKAKQKGLRNIGIMAHIDAGKTTTTERMLYLSGVIENPGEVHHGDTVTDFLPQERERGITIQSAVVTFQWKDCTISLIDTPGHVDFTFEVERSLRVVDSAVAILDASAGVEAQTLTVWRQATENALPRLIFLNKMDKISASLAMCLDAIKSKLKSTPILLQLPVYNEKARTGAGSGLVGILDLVTLQRIEYDASTKGAKYSVRDVSADKALVNKRCELVELLADSDTTLAELVIEKESVEAISETDIHAAIKRITLNNQGVPVLLGSSYKHVGVQPLMDAIARYFPYPTESSQKDPVVEAYGGELCSFAFKTIHDRQLGPLTFLRTLAGTMSSGQKLYNVNRNKMEKLGKIYIPFPGEFDETPALYNGQVAVVSGLKETVTGDTLTSTNSVASIAQKKLAKLRSKSKLTTDSTGDVDSESGDTRPVLLGVNVPEPVFFCSIEPASLMHQKGLDDALACLQREDPSLHVSVDNETGQTVLSGMGELHLEIIHERIKSDFKVDAYLGKLMVAYKETIVSPIMHRLTFERKLGDPPKQAITIELEIHPKNDASHKSILRKGTGKEIVEHLSTSLSERQFRLIQNGVESALRCGPKLGFPIINVQAVLNYFEITRGTTETVIEAGAANCIRQCLQLGTVALLEPIVSLEITVDENYQRQVLDDLSRRKFLLQSVDQKHGNKVITGHAALNELMGYSTSLRTVSSGMGSFSMHFSHYNIVKNPLDVAKITQEVRGF